VRELSLHLLDIVENSISAGAGRIAICVHDSVAGDRLTITVRDDGRGMPADKAARIDDPFVTTRKTRRVGLGLSLLAAAARRCEGDIAVAAVPGGGTEVTAFFRRSHIDRAPLGDLGGTLGLLIAGNPHIDFSYTHRVDEGDFTLDTRELASELDGLSLSDPAVIHQVMENIRRSLRNLAADDYVREA
jgi:hypothetical protein